MSRFIDRLKSGVVIADGAMGTMLQAAGLPVGDAPEVWNLTNRDAVSNVHRGYVDAGAEMVLCNTLGAMRLTLERHGLADRVAEVNRNAIETARGSGAAFVGVSIGPTGEMLPPLGEMDPDDLRAAFAEQIAACDAADCIWIETISDAEEARVAVDAAREASSLPVVLTFTFDAGARGLRSMMGVSPDDVAELFGDVDALGVNCTTPDVCLEALRTYREALPDMPLVARPNAGRPHVSAGRTVFPSTPTMFVEEVKPLLDYVAVLGGCCGTTPEHIALIRETHG
ncbi:hypothetical protein FJZ36_04065 [Candidatus Poribacteria bacterium]|nr:hypothetical protein [Candidatus Poribacteria bacterium]